jgi:hypothetical protein
VKNGVAQKICIPHRGTYVMWRYRPVAHWWDKINAYEAFVGRPERKRRGWILWLVWLENVVGFLGYSAV